MLVRPRFPRQVCFILSIEYKKTSLCLFRCIFALTGKAIVCVIPMMTLIYLPYWRVYYKKRKYCCILFSMCYQEGRHICFSKGWPCVAAAKARAKLPGKMLDVWDLVCQTGRKSGRTHSPADAKPTKQVIGNVVLLVTCEVLSAS